MKSMMRTLIAVLALSLPSVPAMAIDGDQAIEICKGNKRCKYRIESDGEVVLIVDGSIVICPLIGDCICASCPGPAKTIKPSKLKSIMSVPQLLQQNSVK